MVLMTSMENSKLQWWVNPVVIQIRYEHLAAVLLGLLHIEHLLHLLYLFEKNCGLGGSNSSRGKPFV